MKKIVALVLALVLALSLATVAFAADESYFAAKVDGLKLTGVTLKEVKAAGEKNVAVYAPVATVNGKEVPIALNLVEATEADYDYVYVSGDKITYLKNTISGSYTGEAKAVAGVAAGSAKCGDLVVADGVSLYEMDGKYYKAVGSWNLRTVLGNATKDYVVENIYDYIGFTKADLEASVKHYLADGAAYNDIHEADSVQEFLTKAFHKVLDDAKASYGYERFDDWTAESLSQIYDDLVGALTGAFNIFEATGTSLGFTVAKNFLSNLGEDVMDDVIDNICSYLGIEKADDHAWYLGTDASYNGQYLTLNIAREVLKQGTAVKALGLVDGKLITLADAVAGTDYKVIAHSYAVDYATVGGKTAITKVYCEKCKTEFDFVIGDETAAVEKFGAGNFEDVTNEFKMAFTTKFLGKHAVDFDWDTMTFSADWVNGTGYTWDMFDTASRSIKEALAGDRLYIGTAEVESAKTFDAGIALYAGMALMSVAGSAVVIGKKKEF